MNRQDMIKLMGAAALGHVATPVLAVVVPEGADTPSPRLFSMFGEHVRALCSASSPADAQRLFEQNLDEIELSANYVEEIAEEDWQYYGVSRVPGDPTKPYNGEARMLRCTRGEFH